MNVSSGVDRSMPAPELLDSLLRGEIAAAETYEQALEGLSDNPAAEPLHAIQAGHGQAIRFLYERVAAHGGDPSRKSGAFGTLASVVEGTAVLLGNASALAALREGELQGLSSYRAALDHQELPADCRTHIEGELIPAQMRHVGVLTRLLEDAARHRGS